MNTHAGEIRYLYEDIKTIEDAETLSQYAMSRKRDDEIIVIIPRSNISIDKFPEYFDSASELADRHLSDDDRIHSHRYGGEIEVCKKRN